MANPIGDVDLAHKEWPTKRGKNGGKNEGGGDDR